MSNIHEVFCFVLSFFKEKLLLPDLISYEIYINYKYACVLRL